MEKVHFHRNLLQLPNIGQPIHGLRFLGMQVILNSDLRHLIIHAKQIAYHVKALCIVAYRFPQYWFDQRYILNGFQRMPY